MGISTRRCASELREFRRVSQHIYLRCKDIYRMINTTGPSIETYEDPRALSFRLNEEVTRIGIEAYKSYQSLYARLCELLKIINNGLEDYKYIINHNADLWWLVHGLIGGAEGFESFLRDITNILALMRYNKLTRKRQTLPLRGIQKLSHILDRAKSQEGSCQIHVKKTVDGSLRSGARDLTELVKACGATSDNCPNEPTCGYVLRELKLRGFKLRYDKTGLFCNGSDSSNARREVFNRWELSTVPISYLIPQFAILNNGGAVELKDIVFKSFDNQFYKIAGAYDINGDTWSYWMAAPEVAVAGQVTWRRFFPPRSIKKKVSHEACVLGFWSKLADENSEEHKRNVSLLRQHMSKLQMWNGNRIGNSRRLAAELSDLSMKGFGPTREGKLLESRAHLIQRVIVSKQCLLSNLNNDRFASWVVAFVSQSNLNLIGTGDLTLWSHLSNKGWSGRGRKFNLSIRRSAGQYFEGERCDIEVTLSTPGKPSHTVINRIEQLAKIYNGLCMYDKKRVYNLGVFFIKKLMQNNLILKRLGEGNIGGGVQMFNVCRTIEMNLSPKMYDVMRKEEKGWDNEDVDDTSSLELSRTGYALTIR